MPAPLRTQEPIARAGGGEPTPSLSGILILARFPVVSPAPSRCHARTNRKGGRGEPTPSLSGILILARFPVVSPAPLPALRGKSKCQPGSARKNQPQGRAWGAHPEFAWHFDPFQISGCEPRPPPPPPRKIKMPARLRTQEPTARAAHPKFVWHFDPCQISGCEPRPPPRSPRKIKMPARLRTQEPTARAGVGSPPRVCLAFCSFPDFRL